MEQPKRNYLGQPRVEPMPCGRCGGTGKRRTLGSARPFDGSCDTCRGSGWLMPEPRTVDDDE